MQNQTFLQKVAGVFNASSQTFMLIALVGLFAVPIVIAKNLEPMVQSDSLNSPATVKVVRGTPGAVVTTEPVAGNWDGLAAAHSSTSPEVLGANDTNDMRSFVAEDSAGMTAVAGTAKYDVGVFTLNVASKKKFNKTTIFNVKNTTSNQKKFELNVTTSDKVNTQRVVYVGSVAYTVGTNKLPVTVNVAPDQELVFSLMSNKTATTNLVVTLKLVE